MKRRLRALGASALLALSMSGGQIAVTASLTVLASATEVSVASPARAARRPGGGGSFSGGSRSSGSSSRSSGSSSSRSSGSYGSYGGSSSYGGGNFGLFELITSTLFGGFGFVAVVAFIIISSIVARRMRGNLDWQAGVGGVDAGNERRRRVRADLERVRANDPNFSWALLDDFLYALYAQAHTLRGGGRLEQLSAYLGPSARGTLSSLGQVRGVRAIIVGAMRYLSVDGVDGAPAVRITVEFESNYSEEPEHGGEHSYYACERWSLTRARGVLSRTPDRARVFTCPSCGAPLDSMVGGRCQYCQAAVDTGQFDWVVDEIVLVSRESRGPLLTGTTEEQGTDLPSILEPDLPGLFAQMSQRDPSFDWGRFQARVAVIFQAMQSSWSNREWATVRPFVSDNLFQMLAYWIDAYKKEHLRNITEGARIERIELVRISSDKFFDSFTVRLYATSLDYTVTDADGRVVGGNRQRPRRYSEYWTLLRGVGKQGPARTDPNCPSCGAPLRIEMAGTCAYCRAKVTSGEFDWVLSRIEQDEVYEG